MKRVLFLHPAGWDDEHLESELARLQEVMSAVEVVSGRACYAAEFARRGAWAGWPRWAGAAVDRDGAPYFAGYVVPSCVLGRGAAEIVLHALRVGKPVWELVGSEFIPRNLVVELDKDNFKSGWTLTTREE